MNPRVETLDCPRCRKRHEQTFVPFTLAAGPWTHWGVCRETSEPVLMMAKPMTIWAFIRQMGESGLFQVRPRGTPPALQPGHGPNRDS